MDGTAERTPGEKRDSGAHRRGGRETPGSSCEEPGVWDRSRWALALLAEAVEQRESAAPDLGIDPVCARDRVDPRMAPLLRRISLP
ncbi:MAG TPA: hypothetical protein VF006_11310 [Longimicrobium sp.]